MADHEIFGCRVVQKRYSTIGMEDAAAFSEPRILSQMEHPNVVRVLEAQWDPEQDRAITFVTVFCDGRSVAKALNEDYRFSIGQALRLTIQLLRALAYAPEGRLGVAADIYGAGMTLFEMLNGALPYAELDPEKLDRRVTRGLPALPPAAFLFEPHVPRSVRRLVAKAIRPKPDERYATASAFITAIEQVRSIDWTHSSGRDVDGVWEGRWPPHLRAAQQRRYRVESRVLEAGRSKGKRRLSAYQAVSAAGEFARFGVEDETVDPTTAAGSNGSSPPSSRELSSARRRAGTVGHSRRGRVVDNRRH